MPGKNVPAIKVNTVGYPRTWKKLAIFNLEPKSAVVKDGAGKVVYSFKPENIKRLGRDEASQDLVWQADFSSLQNPGRYFVEATGAKSDVFEISDAPYKTALRLSQKHFYFQRCRTVLEKPYAVFEGREYLRPGKCHAHEDIGWDLHAYPNKKNKLKPDAGWHDAGNYDRYVASAAPSAQALLMAYEARPNLFQDTDLNIPESGNKLPDILDEAIYGMRWILSMQDPSGAFRSREAVFDWSESVPPDRERKPHWISAIGTASTAKACAVFAQAARVYKPLDPAFAERAEKASRAAWEFLEKHPERIVVDNNGSKQPLWDDAAGESEVGARLIAAVEVWRSFKLPRAIKQAEILMNHEDTQPRKFVQGAWANLSRWGLMGIAEDATAPEALRNEAKQRLLTAADQLRSQIEEADGYRSALKGSQYVWGHNSNLMEVAHLLAFALKLDPARSWLAEAVRDQWHWVLGRNPNGYSMVTRVGKGPDRMYHMEWGNISPPPPGYLLGGPNGKEMSFLAPGAPAKALLWDNPQALRSGLPAHSMWHWEQSDLWDGGFLKENEWSQGFWAVTEPDIYYNANLVLVAAEVQG
jgi:endoglucanase